MKSYPQPHCDFWLKTCWTVNTHVEIILGQLYNVIKEQITTNCWGIKKHHLPNIAEIWYLRGTKGKSPVFWEARHNGPYIWNKCWKRIWTYMYFYHFGLFALSSVQLKQFLLPTNTGLIAINNIFKKPSWVSSRKNIHNSISLNTQFSLGPSQQCRHMRKAVLFLYSSTVFHWVFLEGDE